ncbi:MAG TPA: (S)-ureidoglycine aminohydrolase [Terriglobia bacterium]|nr:(S)-ureidoglycine aminohydrolase [Terriglobia bacterium]
MFELGHTRSANRHDHLLLTPDTFVRAPLPGMRKANAIIHVAPAVGARFTQFTAEFEEGGVMSPAAEQRFLYVIDGELQINDQPLAAGDFAYVPAGGKLTVTARHASRAAVIEKDYQQLEDVPAPAFFTGREGRVSAEPLEGDTSLEVRHLVPDNPSFDFAVNTMTYQPGAALPMVESHVMEHGLLMLDGGGIYRLGEHWYPVKAGDFIWMAPYCPQWFGALGKTPARYLIYKDWNRHPLG